ncbi:aminopeptidase P family protein [Sulfitobacter sp. M57]|uniref:M24 family metallopeptidase n=1 Tax=unclassified Sulfitobacter TaxID=196795 RepID=UPI0023E0E610|nr:MULTISPECIES: Xaa-Pro peptidase family protein [unclassified Sulfitobacter]MDF3415497.1 aminopeptidase P family protein [Sulfitobacter sp. KE5]MDF3422978.1 aminopeptidase P family protein [Sulfitobacter sp. KE43]MDF3434043.1 aminopeptidase P family protein [Sulfitobacter sp. KE42]MDF3459924.1 aminopeptidase P family protein [Sulfitobacter sp. S74]MDF3463582.1 aminopeptidase P family protein [Sulfitobacter sp. Ks18]
MTSLVRGFPDAEFQTRTRRAQALMAENDLAALLLTTEAELRYYTGFLTRFWESPTRPWFVVLPAVGDPIAVIPSIGAHLMRQTWITDVRCWQAPDYTDDGITLLADTLMEVAPQGTRIGIADQMESSLRMPLANFRQLESMLAPREIVGDCSVTRRLRLVKSDAELTKIKTATAIADRAFDRVPEIAQAGTALAQVFRDFQRLCLEEGADYVPYLAGGLGQDGYGDVISPATDTPLAAGDVLMLDTGLVWDGYFCDFDRNFSVGPPSAEVSKAHQQLITATRAAFDLARPGALMSDLFHAMNACVNPQATGSDAGRLGHGLGMQLTEWPSIIAADHTPLAAGMVLTLEPGIILPNGRIMVHEENIVVTDGTPVWLSTPQPAEIRVI